MGVDLGALQGSMTATLTLGAGTGARQSNVVDLLGFTNVWAVWSSFGSGGGSIQLQFSTGDGNWAIPAQAFDYCNNWNSWIASGAFSSIGGLTGSNTMVFPAYGRYARLNIASGTTTGTYALTLVGHNGPLPPALNITQKVQGNLNAATAVDSWTPTNIGMQSHALQYGFRGVADGTWDRLRTPTVFKSTSMSTSGANAIWTPQFSRKFRLMRYKITVSGNASLATAGLLTMYWYDGASTALGISEQLWLPNAAGTNMAGWSSGWVDLGNGFLSATGGNACSLYLNAALATGSVYVTCGGTEE